MMGISLASIMELDRKYPFLIIVLAVAVVALLDYSAPPTVNIGLLYIAPVSACYWLRRRSALLPTAAACALLVLADYALALDHGVSSMANHLLNMLAIAGVALLDIAADQTRDQMSAILDTVAEGVITTDSTGHIESYNRVAGDIFGYTEAEALGRNISFLMPEPYRTEHDGYLARYAATGQARIIGTRREVQGRRKDGTEFPLEISIADSRLATRRIFTGVVRDISRRKRNEQTIMEANASLKARSEDLGRANEELSQFAHVVSHDLKAPLRAIANYSTWLAEDLDESVLNEDHREYLNEIQVAVQQAETLIEDLLEFSRIGRQEVRQERVQLARFFRQLLASLELGSDAAVSVAPDLPDIDSVPTLLKQIFQNLIINAVKYNLSPLKTVAIEARALPDGTLEIAVRDNGIGIDPKFHERVFQIFQRLHTREEFDGTGIGLAIVRKAARQLGYGVRLESALGAGSSFFVDIPPSPPQGTERPLA